MAIDRYLEHREVQFFCEDGCLVRRVTGMRGDREVEYLHRCDQPTFEAVAHAVGEAVGGTSLREIVDAEGVSFTQADVALRFLDERGLTDARHHRRIYPATDDTHLDAMIEFYALTESVGVL